MYKRVIVVALCVCVFVCVSVTTLAATWFVSMVKSGMYSFILGFSWVFNLWILEKILCSKLWSHLLVQQSLVTVKFFSTTQVS